MNCGWCKGEPKCLDLKDVYRCPKCGNNYLKKREEGDSEELTLEYTPKELLKPVPVRKRKNAFNLYDYLTGGGRLTPRKQKWITEELAKGIVDPETKTPLNVLDPRWSYLDGEWYFE